MKILDENGLADVADIVNNNFAPLNSPALTGTPTAPTAASGTNTTQLATTAFVQNAVSNVDVDIENITNTEIASNWNDIDPSTDTTAYVTQPDMEAYVASEIARIVNADEVQY